MLSHVSPIRARTIALITLSACCDPCAPVDECSPFVVSRGLNLVASGWLDLGDAVADTADTADSDATVDTDVSLTGGPVLRVEVERVETGDVTSEDIPMSENPDGTFTMAGGCPNHCDREVVVAPDAACGAHEDYDARATFTLLWEGEPISEFAPVAVDVPDGERIEVELWPGFPVSVGLENDLHC